MQIKIDFLCRDSILAAPLVLDLVLFLDLANRAGMKGIQEWLKLLFQSTDDRSQPLPQARHFYSTDQAEEHAAMDEGRRPDHTFGPGILRLNLITGILKHTA